MKFSYSPTSINFKFLLLIIALLIAFGTLYYTNQLVKKLQKKEKEIVELYAKGIEYIANNNNPDADITFLFENIIQPIDFPMILTDSQDNPNLADKSSIRNIEIDSTLSEKQIERFLRELIKEFDESHTPINVVYQDTIILTRIHYGDSQLINQIKYYPYFQIGVAAAFILLAYLGFSYVKKSEQKNIWVGMAKETAHQFGTPISSLMGWLEMLKINYNDPNKVLDITEEIQNDVERLNKITNRFSKIGSKPELKEENIYQEIVKVIDYFNRRLPQTGKSVQLNVEGDKNLSVKINAELFDWVIENLIKNSLDAIENKNGIITISISQSKKYAEIEVTDNGKGIDLKNRKEIFRPGFSTKKRGWGLGLSLSKRIIENYHNGKIFLKSSVIGQGTTFKILLRKL
ncbi:MAG: HAMP domain-containing histidine kinase [Ignavibacterium sp.]|nr:HAMP domain-containing histidine kinase [Ignavibacterium sp.]MCX7611469.1 HAMP domain-containing histidine kinase [Ignavibacterium sp.]MDW8374539.1 HAMP domain-containing sensor histidine kinase [Ignavibacteriales bacterium]